MSREARAAAQVVDFRKSLRRDKADTRRRAREAIAALKKEQADVPEIRKVLGMWAIANGGFDKADVRATFGVSSTPLPPNEGIQAARQKERARRERGDQFWNGVLEQVTRK